MSRRSNHGSARQYPRTARLNELLREILADELEHLDDDRLQMLTITSVDIDGDLRRMQFQGDVVLAVGALQSRRIERTVGENRDVFEQILEQILQLRRRFLLQCVHEIP